MKTQMTSADALRQQANQTLAYMQNILEEMHRSMGGRGFHWSSLNASRQLLEEYAYYGMVMDMKRLPRGLDADGVRNLIVGILHKLDTIAKPFLETLNSFQETCAKILRNEAEKIERAVSTSSRRYNNHVGELRLAAHDRVEDVFGYLAANQAEGGGCSFMGFWHLVARAYKTIQALDRALKAELDTDVVSLEMFTGLPLSEVAALGTVIAEPEVEVVAVRSPSYRRVISPRRQTSVVVVPEAVEQYDDDDIYGSPILRRRVSPFVGDVYGSPVLRRRSSPVVIRRV